MILELWFIVAVIISILLHIYFKNVCAVFLWKKRGLL